MSRDMMPRYFHFNGMKYIRNETVYVAIQYFGTLNYLIH